MKIFENMRGFSEKEVEMVAGGTGTLHPWSLHNNPSDKPDEYEEVWEYEYTETLDPVTNTWNIVPDM